MFKVGDLVVFSDKVKQDPDKGQLFLAYLEMGPTRVRAIEQREENEQFITLSHPKLGDWYFHHSFFIAVRSKNKPKNLPEWW